MRKRNDHKKHVHFPIRILMRMMAGMLCASLILTGCGGTGSGSERSSAWSRNESSSGKSSGKSSEKKTETKAETETETEAPAETIAETETALPAETEPPTPQTEPPAPQTEPPAPQTEPPAPQTEDPDAAVRDLLRNVPTLVFSSGAGAWATELTFEPDNENYAGYFRGNYHDSNMGESGEGYDSTIYICNFTGYFYDFEQVDDHIWTMHRGRFEMEHIEGEEWIVEDDGVRIRYVASVPYGVEEGDLFYLYMPGASTEGMSEDFLMWMQMPNGYEPLGETIDFWAIYNVDAGYGFYGGER